MSPRLVLIGPMLTALAALPSHAHAAPSAVSAAGFQITEIHYDNVGADEGEAVEISGPAGYDVTGFSIVLYNGNNGAVYDTVELSGLIPAGGAFTVYVSPLQNGSPDGIAWVDANGAVLEFLSYEGSFSAVGGPADALVSSDISVAENGSTPVGYSLQNVGGVWQPASPNTFAPALLPGGPDCTRGIAPISLVQGNGAATPCEGQVVTIEGVVVGDYEGPSPNLRGFFVQEEDADQDADPATSEGIFVFHNDEDSVALGDRVRVTGVAAEFQGQTQLGFPSDITLLSSGNAVTPSAVSMPFPDADYLERYEGMLVTFEQPLYVTEYFQLGRFGELVVSSGDRLRQPTDIAEPGAAANAVQAANELNRLKIDDALNNQNPDPILFGGGGQPLSASNPLRGGDTIQGATGVLTYGWAGNAASPNAYRLRVVGDLSDSGLVVGGIVPVFESENARPPALEEVGGSLHIASFNVLNYFLTIDSGDNTCGTAQSAPDNRGCRGADSADELDRQRTKLLAALSSLGADIFGLIELENSTGVEPLADIADGLNASLGAGTYDFVETGTIGADVIKVGLLYRPAAVSPAGAPAVLDYGDNLTRPSLLQSFVSADGELLTVVVNHFKSKGCNGASGPNMDQGDGQGCWNPTRAAAAGQLISWIAGDPTGTGGSDVLLLGDFNSYAKEDPIAVIEAAGYVDLGRAFGGDAAYSYVFDGQWGYLDYAFASPSAAARVTGAVDHHINADEVPALDYNTEFKSSSQIVSLFAPDEFRTSDHDPVVIGLCDAAEPVAAATPSPPVLWPPNGKLVPVEISVEAVDSSAVTVKLLSVDCDEPDCSADEPDVVVDDDLHLRLRACREGEGDGRVYTLTYTATDACSNTTTFSTEVVVPHDMGH